MAGLQNRTWQFPVIRLLQPISTRQAGPGACRRATRRDRLGKANVRARGGISARLWGGHRACRL